MHIGIYDDYGDEDESVDDFDGDYEGDSLAASLINVT